MRPAFARCLAQNGVRLTLESILTVMNNGLEVEDHVRFMRRAIELSLRAGLVEKSGGCFGAVVVDPVSRSALSEGYNQVVSRNDPTWHGEMEAIRNACKRLRSPHLEGCVLYTSSEPCPMCLAACMWARVGEVYYGASYTDVKAYGNFKDEDYLLEMKKEPNERKIQCHQILREEAVKVWEEYHRLPDRMPY